MSLAAIKIDPEWEPTPGKKPYQYASILNDGTIRPYRTKYRVFLKKPVYRMDIHHIDNEFAYIYVED